MLRFCVFFYLLLIISCDNKSTERPVVPKSSNINTVEEKLIIKEERLTDKEAKFLNVLAKENPFLNISDSVERYYAHKSETAVFNRLVFQNDSLIKKGYVYYELEFYGKIDDVSITYKFSMGQASFGFGSISGNDMEDYLHTYKSCGVTSCFINIYRNGQKLFEKETNN